LQRNADGGRDLVCERGGRRRSGAGNRGNTKSDQQEYENQRRDDEADRDTRKGHCQDAEDRIPARGRPLARLHLIEQHSIGGTGDGRVARPCLCTVHVRNGIKTRNGSDPDQTSERSPTSITRNKAGTDTHAFRLDIIAVAERVGSEPSRNERRRRKLRDAL
jgi:hypothetical protein